MDGRDAHMVRLARVEAMARAMDSAFRIPGTRIRFGWDSILGLVPGLGDTLTALPAIYTLRAAHLAGAPKSVMSRMLFNIAVDWLIGLVPFLGDVMDIGYKANLRNAALLKAHVTTAPSATSSALRNAPHMLAA